MLFIGLDIGFGDTKVVTLGNKEIMDSFPTLIAEPTASALSEEKVEIPYGGRHYVVGCSARTEPGCFQLYDLEDLIRYSPLIVEYVFTSYDIDKKDNEHVSLCVSCPPSGWRERKRLLKGIKRVHDNTIILPQGYGAFLTVIEKFSEEPETVLVLDLGYNTIDWLVVEKRRGEWQAVRGDTLTRMGVMKLVEIFRSELGGKLSELPERVLRELLRKGEGRIYGEKIDLMAQKQRAEKQYREILFQALKGVVGEIWQMIDVIVCTGGGVYYFDPQRSLPHALVIIPEKPEFANALGQAKWLEKTLKS